MNGNAMAKLYVWSLKSRSVVWLIWSLQTGSICLMPIVPLSQWACSWMGPICVQHNFFIFKNVLISCRNLTPYMFLWSCLFILILLIWPSYFNNHVKTAISNHVTSHVLSKLLKLMRNIQQMKEHSIYITTDYTEL